MQLLELEVTDKLNIKGHWFVHFFYLLLFFFFFQFLVLYRWYQVSWISKPSCLWTLLIVWHRWLEMLWFMLGCPALPSHMQLMFWQLDLTLGCPPALGWVTALSGGVWESPGQHRMHSNQTNGLCADGAVAQYRPSAKSMQCQFLMQNTSCLNKLCFPNKAFPPFI